MKLVQSAQSAEGVKRAIYINLSTTSSSKKLAEYKEEYEDDEVPTETMTPKFMIFYYCFGFFALLHVFMHRKVKLGFQTHRINLIN